MSGSLNVRLMLPVITKTAGRASADAVSNAAGGCCQRVAFRPVSLSSEKYACVPVAPALNVERFGDISLSGGFSFCVYEAAFRPASTATSRIKNPRMNIFCFNDFPVPTISHCDNGHEIPPSHPHRRDADRTSFAQTLK